jgi:CubicO group peptidase (beta-lactamase class C family)
LKKLHEQQQQTNFFLYLSMKLFYTILLLISTLSAFAQTKSIKKSPLLIEAAPESAGMSKERLARIDSMCQKAVSNSNIPGVVALVARNGRIVYYKAFGMADVEKGSSMKRDAIFRIASQTKAITATAVMMLWEQGRFRLDDPISKYIPEFKNPQLLKTFKYSDTSYTTEPAKSEITISQLLTHTSGLGYGMIDADERFKMIFQKAGVTDLFTTQNISIEESVKKLAKLPLHFNPGEKYSYSEGLDVLGYFIEVISGEPFDVYLRKHIFEPLGMNDTWFYLPQEKAARLVTVQQPVNGKWAPYPTTFYDPHYPAMGARRFFSGGAGLSSTAKDYATFLQLYLNGGELNGVRLLSRTTVQTIMGNQTDTLFGGGKNSYYGLAFGVLTDKGQASGGQGSAGTFDWGGYFNTQYFADPKEKIIGVLMKQTQGPVSDDTGWMFRLLAEQAVDD